MEELPRAQPLDTVPLRCAIQSFPSIADGRSSSLKNQMNEKVVLVVEDEPALVAIYRRVLEHNGYQVLSALSGEDALEVVKKHDGNIDLLLSDIVLQGMSGRELVWRLWESHPEIYVILASGYADQDGALQMMEENRVAFIAKPFDLNLLLDMIRETIGDPAPQT